MFLLVRALAVLTAMSAGLSILLCTVAVLGLITGSRCAGV